MIKIETRKYQQKAITAVVNGLKTEDRVQLHMAPGSGKTITASEIRRKMKPELTGFFVPSVHLLFQTHSVWSRFSKPFNALAVTAGRMSQADRDELDILATHDVTVTTSVDRIEQFLRQSGSKVILSTYKSAPKVVEALRRIRGKWIDLAFFDEGHHLSGSVDKRAVVLLEKTARIKKRVSMTATPRVVGDGRAGVVGMENLKIFGPAVYTLPFRKAVEDKILVDYRIVVAAVEKHEILNMKIGADFNEKLALVATMKAVTDLKLKRGFTFHSKVERAVSFATKLQLVFDENTDLAAKVDTLNSTHSLDHRTEVLGSMLTNTPSITSNVRVLGEGVDFSALDFITIVDPKSSITEIVQNIGRVMRQYKGKKYGSIILPVMIDDNLSIDQSSHKTVFHVAKALAQYDSMLESSVSGRNTNRMDSNIINEFMSRHIKVVGVNEHEHKKIKFIKNSIKMQVIDMALLRRNVDQRMEQLKSFVEKNGRMPKGDKCSAVDKDELSLGGWVRTRLLNTSVMYDESVANDIHNVKAKTNNTDGMFNVDYFAGRYKRDVSVIRYRLQKFNQKPIKLIGKKRYYSESTTKLLDDYFLDETAYTVDKLSEELKKPIGVLQQLINKLGIVPSKKVRRRCFYCDEDIVILKKHIADKKVEDDKKVSALYSVTEAADKMQVSTDAVRYALKKHGIKPKRQHGNKRYYLKSQIHQVVKNHDKETK